MKPPLRLFFSYFGGKHRAAKHYPAPRYDRIVEPFAGSAGYSLNHHEADVLLVERDPAIAAIWRYLLSSDGDDIAALPLVGEGWESTDDLTHLPTGARNLIGMWLNKATAYPRKRPCRAVFTHPEASYWSPRIRERIAGQVSAVRHWRLIEGDYQEAGDVTATWFIDPPYMGAGHQYRHGSRDINYASLADWCKRRTGQVMVCEGPGASWLPFAPLAEIKGQRGQVEELAWFGDDAREFHAEDCGGRPFCDGCGYIALDGLWYPGPDPRANVTISGKSE